MKTSSFPMTLLIWAFFTLPSFAADAPAMTIEAEIAGNAAPYLRELPLGSMFLPHGVNSLTPTLPPRDGFDCLRILKHKSQSSDYRRLVGLPIDGVQPSPEQINQLPTLPAAIGDQR